MGTTEPEAYGPDAQPVEPQSLARRIVGRVRCSGRRWLRADRARERHRRVDPHPRVAVRCRRAQAVAWTRAARTVPADAAVTMLSEGAITRTMRDTAAVLDGLARRRRFPTFSLDEVGRDPGRLRVGLCIEAVHRRRARRGLSRRLLATQRVFWKTSAITSRRRGPLRSTTPTCSAAPRDWPPRRAPSRSTSGRPPSAASSARTTSSRRRGQLVSHRARLTGTDVVRALQRQAGADSRHPKLVARWLRPVAHADDRRARPAARRVQAGLQARAAAARSPACSTRPASPRCHSRSAGPTTACRAACSSSPPTAARTCSSASARSSSSGAVGAPPPAPRLTAPFAHSTPAGGGSVSKRSSRGRACVGCTRLGRGRAARSEGCARAGRCARRLGRASRRHRRAARCARRP